MKRIFNIITMLHLSFLCFGQAVTGAASESKMQEQALPLENSYIDYFSKRAQYVDKNSKSISAEEQKELDQIVNQAGSIDMNSYQYNYLEFINRGRTAAAFEYLEKAEAAYPNNAELFDDFLYHYELVGNDSKKAVYCKKLYESNTISAGVMEYNYNVLMSVDKDAILITNGSDDTYPLFIWQTLKKVRNDVKVINFDMLNDPEYNSRIASEYGIKMDAKSSDSPIEKITYILKNNPSKKIFVGHTLSQVILKKFQSNLYLSGLTYQYSTTPLENVAEAVKRFENDFDLEQLKKTQENGKVNALNFNYTLPLITFMEYYYSSGDQKKYQETRELTLKVARKVGKESFILDYLTAHDL